MVNGRSRNKRTRRAVVDHAAAPVATSTITVVVDVVIAAVVDPEATVHVRPNPSLSLSRLFTLELRAAAVFAMVVAGITGAVGIGCHVANLSIVQAPVHATVVEAGVAAVLAPLVAGFIFFLARRFAWQSMVHAAATAVACTGIGVVLHDNVLSSDLYYGAAAGFITLPALWLRAAVSPEHWSGISTASLMPAYVAIVVVSGFASAGLQHWASGGRSVKRIVVV